MKKFLSTLWLTLAMVIGTNICFVNSAAAVDIQINNQIGKKLYVAVLTHNENSDSWFVRFWYSVPANSFRTLSFPTHNKGHVWIHAHNSDRSWGSEKAWTVVSESNSYKLKDGCPAGSNRRQVAFDSYNIGQDGVVRVNYRP